MKFEKWEGLGNDFVLLRDPANLSDEEVRGLCDRRFGVGADGVLILERRGVVPRMIVRNADGSRPEMCGNGLRCVAAALGGQETSIQTDAGPKLCAVRPVDGDTFEVDVEMGMARRGEDLVESIEGRRVSFLRVDMGNPHAVTFDLTGEAALTAHGDRLSNSVPGGVNVELCARRRDGDIDVLVWERGVGPTLACGTGACAVAFAACSLGLAVLGAPQSIRLPGGTLRVTVFGDGRVRMSGPARRVFVGHTSGSPRGAA